MQTPLDQTPGGMEGPGSKIGPYKLLQLIGEGGFGFVYMAEQHEPVRRKVALKIVKPGMDTREVIARFEAERQALALMDHPNIARVIDAGATASGRPYFVMELVRGVSLTEFCDKNQLGTRDRLRLFSTICQAVQHAHQKGIVHRDVKPSNVLVTLHDGQPVPKIIDFGVAKALNQQLTEKTLFTAYGQMVGTPQYMSPEQAEMSGLDVDTRSDIYSLGVLLYELLTGTTPLDSQRLRSAGFVEMQRLIREEEPPRPSTRISTLGEAATSIAQHRSVDPKRLRQELRGELDWIVMKALEKDRNRRYATASGFMDDVQRYLRDEPVLACPPSAAYRLQKFARRNKALLAAAAVVAGVLVASVAVSAVTAVRAIRAERLAQQQLASEIAARAEAERSHEAEATQRQNAERERDRANAARQQATAELEHAREAERLAQANFDQARATVDDYLTTVSEDQLMTIPGMQPLRQSMLDAALAFYEQFVQQRPQDAALRAGLAAAYARLARVQSDLRQRDVGEQYYVKAQALYEALLGEGHDVPKLEQELADVYYWQGRYNDALALCQRCLRRDPRDRAVQLLLANIYNTTAIDDGNANAPRISLGYHREAYRLRSERVSAEPDNPQCLGDLGSTVNNVGVLLAGLGRDRNALEQYQRGVEIAERAFMAARYSVLYGRFLAIGRSNEAGYLASRGMKDEAIAAQRRGVEVWQRLARDNPAMPALRAEVAKAYRALANLQRRLGRDSEAAETVLQSRLLIENLPQESAEDVYSLAVIYATLAKDTFRGDSKSLEGPPAADFRTSMRALSDAVTLGYRNREAIQKESAFDAFRDRPELVRILALIELLERIVAADKDVKKLADMLTLRDELQPLQDEPLAAVLVAHMWRVIAEYALRAGDTRVAETDGLRARKLLEASVEAHESMSPKVAREMSRVWRVLAQVHFRARRYTDAVLAWKAAREALERVRSTDAESELFNSELAAIEYDLGEACGTLGAFAGAAEHYEAGYSISPSKNPTTAIQHAAVLLSGGKQDEYLRLCRWMTANFDDNDLSKYMISALAEAMSRTRISPDRNLVTPAAIRLQVDPQDAWARLGLAVGYLRSGAPYRCLEVWNDYEPSPWSAGPYYQALAHHLLGRDELARERLEHAEVLYRRTLTTRILLDAHPAMYSAVQQTRFGDSRAAWYDILIAQLARFEATAAIEGQPRPDPWKHLLTARAFQLLGEPDRAHAEFALAEQAGGADPEFWIVRGRIHAQLQDGPAAEKAFQQAVEIAPHNVQAWIARGRYFLERGLADKGEADLAHAASLTPNELHQFLNGGWWFCGPVPADSRRSFRDQILANPTPLTPAKLLTLKEEPGRTFWDMRLPDLWGAVYFGIEKTKPGHFVLATTVVFSPDERTTTIWLGGHDQVRLWLNRKLVHEISVPVTWAAGLDCVPITLRPGRNDLVIEATHANGPESMFVRLGDSPFERALQMVRLGLWQESLPFWEECGRRQAEDGGRLVDYSLASLLCGNSDTYKRSAGKLLRLAQSRLKDTGTGVVAVRTANLAASSTCSPAEVMALAEKVCTKPATAEWWLRAPQGMAYYRAGRFAEQVDWLKPYEEWQELHYFCKLWSALGYHQLGQTDRAKQLLQQADAGFLRERSSAKSGPRYRYVHGGGSWFEACEYVVYRREAARLIEGKPDAFEKIVAEFVAEGNRELARRTPELAAYDEAVAYMYDRPVAWRARGRRLTELARWEEAQRDLDWAITLKADEPRTWIAYAEYHLARGDANEAANCVLRAHQHADVDVSDLKRQELTAALSRFDDPTLEKVELATRAELVMLRARDHADAGRLAEAESEFLRAVESDPQNPETAIATGQFYAERGQQEKAEEHYARAATLTPGELNKFVERGWWAMGPYPHELPQFCPPEVEPDPSHPTRVLDSKTGLSDEPQPWVHVPTGKLGVVNLRGVPEYQEGNCYYALSLVHSPDDRSALFMVYKDQPLRVWVNGNLFDHRVPAEYSLEPHYEPWYRLPVFLKAGRNTIVVKTALPTFAFRIGDSVRDRTVLLAEQERFAESVRNAGLMKLTASDLLTSKVTFLYATVLASEPDHLSTYERICGELVQITNPDLYQKYVIPFACAQRPNASFDMHAERLVSHVEEFAAARPEPWTRLTAALVNYRAGKHDRARELIALSGWHPHVLPLQSLLQHQAGDAAAAAESLAQALKVGAEYEVALRTSDRSDFQGVNQFWWWYDWAAYVTLLLEAEQTIRGDSNESRALKLQAEETLAQRWTSSPELSAFDHAVLFGSIGPSGETKYPATLLARGRQLAALGRWDEAAADFAKASKIDPNDWQVQLAQASFLAERNDLAGAAAEFEKLVNATSGEKWWLQGRFVERELAGHEALLAARQAEQPQAAILWRLRGEREIRRQNWESALQAFSSGDPYWSQSANRAALHCLMGDFAAFALDCQDTEALLKQNLPDDPYTIIHRVSVRVLHVANEQEARALLKLAQEGQRGFVATRDAKLNLGLAYYRNGQYEAALHWLEEALAVPSWWAEHSATWAALAMCHEKLGNHDEARRWFAKSTWWIEFTRQATELPEFIGPYSLDYFQLVRSHLLYREAQSLIAPQPTP